MTRTGETTYETIPVLLLVGGMGTRLRPVLASKPKPLAAIGGRPFLELLVLQLRVQGIQRLVMCSGFQADQIEEEFGDGSRWNVTIKHSKETQPLGTAGAIKCAARFLSDASDFLVLNGDSFLEMDFRELICFHRQQGGWASIAVRRVADAARYGTVRVDGQSRVVRFSEKMGIPEPGLINGGIYAFKKELLEIIHGGPVSLEKEVLPRLLERGVFAREQNGLFIDIGTPEDYARAQNLYRRLSEAALSIPQGGTRENLIR